MYVFLGSLLFGLVLSRELLLELIAEMLGSLLFCICAWFPSLNECKGLVVRAGSLNMLKWK